MYIPDWFLQHYDYLECVLAIGEYNPDIDYAGPTNSPELSKLIPNTLFGIDMNIAFYLHDALYEKGGDEGDRLMADCAMDEVCKLCIEKYRPKWYMLWAYSRQKRLALKAAEAYYQAVRAFGSSSFKYKK
jgi:hypothetical protein